jgi:flagellar biosynthesis protein FliR
VTVKLDATWLMAFLLAMVRVGAWIAFVPPFSNRKVVPPIALVGVAGGLAVLCAPMLEAKPLPTSTGALIGSVLVQALTGVALGLSVQILISAVSSAGSMVDLFGGINLPPSIDPLSENQTPLIGQFYEQVAIVLLFVSNGELLLVRGFQESFTVSGLTVSDAGNMASIFSGDLATFFTATLEIAVPIVVVLFAAQVGLAMLAKAAPQVNVWWLGFPVQAMLSLLLVAVAIRVLPGYVDHIVMRSLADTAALLRGH